MKQSIINLKPLILIVAQLHINLPNDRVHNLAFHDVLRILIKVKWDTEGGVTTFFIKELEIFRAMHT
jgi:hypothetical protein